MAKKIYIGIVPRYRWDDYVGTGADTIWFNETMLGTNYSLNPDTGEVRIENGVIATSSINPVGLFFVSGKDIRQVTGIITTSTDRLRVNTKVYHVEEITDGSAVSVARPVKNSYIGIDGVARKITKAYIGVNGVARLCWSSEKKVYIEVTGVNSTGAYVEYNGTKYQAGSTFEAAIGDVITLYCQLGSTQNLLVNGSHIKFASGGLTYEYTVVSNVTIEFEQLGSDEYSSGDIYIAEY